MLPIVSVVICTLNRRVLIESCVESIVCQRFPANLFEIIVVDNGSSDGTWEWLVAYQASGLSFFPVRCPSQGLSHARNFGTQKSKGELIAFIDDDAVADPMWLANIVDVFDRRPPSVAVVGGKVLPKWGSLRPSWLNDDMLGFLSIIDLGKDEHVVEKERGVFGVNMAIRKSFLEEVGLFRTELGRSGNNLVSNEEVYLQHRLREQGYLVLFTPHAIVHHYIEPGRLTMTWFLRRAYYQGYSAELVQALTKEKVSLFERLKQTRHYVKRIITILVVLTLRMQNPERLELAIELASKLGRCRGLITRKF